MSAYASGASASLNKTIKEIVAVRLGKIGASGPLRAALHTELLREFDRVAAIWFKLGFKRAHSEARKEFQRKGRVPKILHAQAKMKFTRGARKSIRLISVLK